MSHVIVFTGTGRSAYIPEDLSECDERQYIEMSALIFQFMAGEITYEDLRIYGLYALLNMIRVESKDESLDKLSNIYQASELLDSFFETDGDRKIVKQYYNHNPIKKVIGYFTVYHGPADEFNNVRWREYIDGLNHFLDFNETGEAQYLFKLMAVFYRKRKNIFQRISDQYNVVEHIDVREKYNAATVDKRAKLLEKHHIGVAYGFYLFFASMQKYVSTASVFVQGKEIDLSVLFDPKLLGGKKQKESNLPGLGLKGLEFTLAESGVFGSIDGVWNAFYWDVLLRLYDLVKRDQDAQANSK